MGPRKSEELDSRKDNMKISIRFPTLSREIFRKLEEATRPRQPLAKFVELTSVGQFDGEGVRQVDLKVASYHAAADDGYTQHLTVTREILDPLWNLVELFPQVKAPLNEGAYEFLHAEFARIAEEADIIKEKVTLIDQLARGLNGPRGWSLSQNQLDRFDEIESAARHILERCRRQRYIVP